MTVERSGSSRKSGWPKVRKVQREDGDDAFDSPIAKILRLMPLGLLVFAAVVALVMALT